jgi:hypothetical protein
MTPADRARALYAAEPDLTRQQIADRLGLSLSQVQRALRGAPRVPGGGRPRKAETVVVSVRLTRPELELVDAARGRDARGAWCRRAVVTEARRSPGVHGLTGDQGLMDTDGPREPDVPTGPCMDCEDWGTGRDGGCCETASKGGGA